MDRAEENGGELDDAEDTSDRDRHDG